MTETLRTYFDWFLFDTLLWTGVLIGFVLLLRRPVARHLGAGTAYALWALPALRLLIPPVTLPAWMASWFAPARDTGFDPYASALAAPAAEPASFTYFPPASAPIDYAPVVAETTDFVTLLIVAWLTGAAVFLVRRFWLYAELRRELLDDAVPVGEVGRIRLIETPAISGPIAFGVLDKVVALPVGFMTLRNRQARDLAIAHEIEHHRGHDLLVNILVQPLFAVHWFNPLGYMGWMALRRDQEAFCDARVVAARPREERAAYAGVIADFARRPQVAPRPALAAPMACPVLGDKSIIHRLRNLSMTDVSPRRRMAARAGIVAALFALPMTASICYASAAEPPAPPEAPLPPEPPAPPELPLAAPEAPLPPEPPAPPEASDWDSEAGDVERDVQETRTADGRVERRVVIRRRDGEGARHVEHRIIRRGDVEGWSDEDRAELEREMAELRKEFAENGKLHREIQIAMAEVHTAAAEASAAAPRVVMSCRDKENIVISETDSKGRTTMFVCEANGNRIALKAIRSARKAIESDRNLSDKERAEALRELDEEITANEK
ncbi:MAG: M56 family metallopeptidase [Erythrobacter sp.]|jgi:beta-lactamase regulating signal transducer with metallopeptidase domain